MLLTYTTKYVPNKTESLVLDSMGYAAYKLWNVANYEKRNYKKLGFKSFPDWYDQKKRLKDNYFYKNLPSQTAQEVLNVLQQSWKSYFKLSETKGVANPKPPRFKQSAIQFAFLNNGFKVVDGNIRFSIPQALKTYLQEKHSLKINYLMLETDIFKQFSKIKQVRFLKDSKGYRITVVYEVKDTIPLPNNNNYLLIDLGVHNLFTCLNSKTGETFIVGRKYLSVQRYFDKKIAYYQSISDTQQVAAGVKYPKPSKRVLQLYRKKKDSAKDYLHKCTKYIADYCKANEINTVIIGDIKGIRKDKNLGHENNQKFHSLPYNKIYDTLQYKLTLCGIRFIKQNEAYSSQCPPTSPKVSKTYAKKSNRKKRGLYKLGSKIYSADCVGAYNIGRLAVQDGATGSIQSPMNLLSSPKIAKVAV